MESPFDYELDLSHVLELKAELERAMAVYVRLAVKILGKTFYSSDDLDRDTREFYAKWRTLNSAKVRLSFSLTHQDSNARILAGLSKDWNEVFQYIIDSKLKEVDANLNF